MFFNNDKSNSKVLNRRSFLKTLGSAAVLVSGQLGLSHVFAEAKDNKVKPNILFVITDQQYADAMSCVDSRWLNTPAMDSIAKKGVRFNNAYVNLPVCLPQRYSIFTGRLPCTRLNADPNNKPQISLGNQAKKAGYETAFFGKWHIQDETFTRQDKRFTGFDINEGGKDISMTDSAIDYLSQKKSNPFLAVVSYYNPHDICEWGRKKAGRTEGINMRNGEVDVNPPLDKCPPLPDNYQINADEAEAVTERRKCLSRGVPNAQYMAMSFTEDDWRQYRWAYNRLIELADKQISRLLESLEQNGLAENTVIIFTSDHGDGMGTHRWHQKSVLYEESCRIPFIISCPGKTRKNETDDRLISVGIDMMATISDIVGVDMPEGAYYGKSALPFVMDAKSTAPTHEYVVSEANVTSNSGQRYEGRAVRTRKFKYHAWDQGKNREQLFDMVNDPGETTNLVADPAYASELNKHRALFANWLKKTDDTYSEKLTDDRTDVGTKKAK